MAQGGKSMQDRELAAEVRSLCLEEIKVILEGDDADYKKQLVLKMSTSILPRLNELSGPDGGEIPLPLLGGKSNGKNHDSNDKATEAQEE